MPGLLLLRLLLLRRRLLLLALAWRQRLGLLAGHQVWLFVRLSGLLTCGECGFGVLLLLILLLVTLSWTLLW